MRRLIPLLAPLLAPALTLIAAPVPAQETAPRVDGRADAEGARVIINEVNDAEHPQVRIFATVLRDGEPVPGLGAEDFRVREDEVDQAPLTVEPQLPPLSVVVAIDTSGSMAQRMEETRAAAASFVEGLGERDAVQPLRFAREIEPLTPMTTTKDEAVAAIEALAARGDTALYDALARSVELVAERPGRKAIVVLSDGVDDDGTGQPLSEATIGQVIDRATEVSVPIFAVGLGTEMDEAVLTEIADATGAIYLNAPEASELEAVYARIGDQLSGQYAIAYTSSLPADGTARRIDLEGPGGRDSRTYAPEGDPAAEPEPEPESEPAADAGAGGCPPLDALRAVEPDVARAQERYDEDLIDVVARNRVRDDAVAEVEAVAMAEAVPYPCMVEAMTALKDFHDRDLVDVVQRNRLRDHLAAPLGDACAGETTLDGVVGCFEILGRAYDDDLIDVVTRNSLMERAAEPLVDELAEIDDPDAALRRINELYDAGLIDVVMRNDLRERILAQE